VFVHADKGFHVSKDGYEFLEILALRHQLDDFAAPIGQAGVHAGRPVPHENRVGVLTCAVLLRSSRWGRESRGVLLTFLPIGCGYPRWLA
jgi:hypothetical protein